MKARRTRRRGPLCASTGRRPARCRPGARSHRSFATGKTGLTGAVARPEGRSVRVHRVVRSAPRQPCAASTSGCSPSCAPHGACPACIARAGRRPSAPAPRAGPRRASAPRPSGLVGPGWPHAMPGPRPASPAARPAARRQDARHAGRHPPARGGPRPHRGPGRRRPDPDRRQSRRHPCAQQDRAERCLPLEPITRRHETGRRARAARHPFIARDQHFPDQAVAVAAIDRLRHRGSDCRLSSSNRRPSSPRPSAIGREGSPAGPRSGGPTMAIASVGNGSPAPPRHHPGDGRRQLTRRCRPPTGRA